MSTTPGHKCCSCSDIHWRRSAEEQVQTRRVEAERDGWRERYERQYQAIGKVLEDVREYRYTGEPANSDVMEIQRLISRAYGAEALEPKPATKSTCIRCGAEIEPVPPNDVPGPPDPPLCQHVDDKSCATFAGQHVGPRCKRKAKALEAKT